MTSYVGCKQHKQQKDLLKAIMAWRQLPRTEDAPIVASADFTPDGIATTFH